MYRCLGFQFALSLWLAFCGAAATEAVPDAKLAVKYDREGEKRIGICLGSRPENVEAIRDAFAALCDVPVANVTLLEDTEDCALAVRVVTETSTRSGIYFSDTLPLERLRGVLQEAGLRSISVAALLPTSPAMVSGGVEELSFAGATTYAEVVNLDAPLPTWTMSYGWRPIDFILHGLFLLAPMVIVGTLVSLFRVHARRTSIKDRPAAVRVAAMVDTYVSLGFMLLWPCYVSLWSPLTWLVFLPDLGLLPGVALMAILPSLASMVFVAWLRAALFPALSLLPESRWTRAELWRQGAVIGAASLIPWIVYTGPVFLDLMNLPGDFEWSLAAYGFFGAIAAVVGYMLVVPIWIGNRVGVGVRPALASPIRERFEFYWSTWESSPTPALYLESWERGAVAAGLKLPGSIYEKGRAMRPGVELNGRFAALADERAFHMAVMRQSSRKTFASSINGLIASGLYYPAMLIAIGLVPPAYISLTDANGLDCFGDPVFVSGWVGCILGTALLCAFHHAWHSRRVSLRIESKLLEQFNDPETQFRSLLLEARCTALPLAWPVWCRSFLPCAPMERAFHVALKSGLSEVDIASVLEEVDAIESAVSGAANEHRLKPSGDPTMALGGTRMACMLSIIALGVGAVVIDTRLLPDPLPVLFFLPVTVLVLTCFCLAVENLAHGFVSARIAAKLRDAHPSAEPPLVPAIVGAADTGPLACGAMVIGIDADALILRNGEEDILIPAVDIASIHLVRSPEIFPLYAVEIAWSDPVNVVSRKWHMLPIGERTAHENNVTAAKLALRLHAWFVNHTRNDSREPTKVATTPLKERLPRMLGSGFVFLALGGYMGWRSPELLDPATTDFLCASLFICTPLTIWCGQQLYRRWFEARGIAALCDERD